MANKPDKRAYKATFLLDTRGLTDSVDTLVAKLRDVIGAVQGEVTEVENHGLRDFARPPSRAYPNGTYVTFTFTGPVTAAPALREKIRLDRTVNRLVVKLA
jgi:small subunit ribosomal protein S6